jgi:hypothetical protein
MLLAMKKQMTSFLMTRHSLRTVDMDHNISFLPSSSSHTVISAMKISNISRKHADGGTIGAEDETRRTLFGTRSRN